MSRYKRKDHLYKQAKESGYRSRAAYKLIELDKKHRILSRGMKVVDLGCFPGSWMQVALERVGKRGAVTGIDLRQVEPLTINEVSATILLGDIRDEAMQQSILDSLGGKADVVLSDMSPQLSGISFRDVAASVELVRTALEFCKVCLRNKGTFVAKLFPGEDTDMLLKEMPPLFDKVANVRLKSTRTSSNELYVVGKTFRIPEERNQ